MVTNQLKNFRCLDQSKYGGKNDCTLTSLTAAIDYYCAHAKPVQEIYSYVESIAKKYGYTGDKGTDPWFIRTIYNKILNKFIHKNAKSNVRYLKNVGFTYEFICRLIDQCKPVIMSVWKAGKYKDHTITIIGYNTAKRTLIVADNWKTSPQILSWNDVGCICSINWY